MKERALPPHLRHFLAYDRHTRDVDELAQVVLKGHLVIESVLDNIIGLMLFHPEYMADVRLGFNQKVKLARSICLRKNEHRAWTVLIALNAVRNEVAHNLKGEKRKIKLERLKRIFLDGLDPAIGEDVENGPEHLIGALACAECINFLTWCEDEIKVLRGHIDVMEAKLNLDQERKIPS